MPNRTINFGADATDADWQIRDNDPANGGDLVIEHLPTGAEFRYDTADDAWVPNQPIGTSVNPVPGTSHIANAEGTSLQYESVSAEKVSNKRTVHPTNYPGADLGEQINSALDDVGKDDVHIDISGDSLTVSTVVDLTDSKNLSLDTRGAEITISGVDVGFDATDVQDFYFYWGRIIGDSANPPKIGILQGNYNADPNQEGFGQSNAERNKFIGGNMVGHYDQAALFHHGREMTQISGYYLNNNDQGYAVGVSDAGEIEINGTIQNVVSPTKGDLAANGDGSTSKTWMTNISFFSRTNTGDGNLWLAPMQGGRIENAEFRSLGEPMVVMDGGQDDITFSDVVARTGTDKSDFNATFIRHQNERGVSFPAVTNLVLEDLTAALVQGTAPDGDLVNHTLSASIDNLEMRGRMSMINVNGLNNANIGKRSKLKNVDVPTIDSWSFDTLEAENVTGSHNGRFSVEGQTLKGKNSINDYIVDVVDEEGVYLQADKTEIINAKVIHSGANRAVRVEGGTTYQRLKNIHVESSGDMAYLLNGDNILMESCTNEAVTGDALDIRGNDSVVSSSRLNGNVTISGSRNVISGTLLIGDVTFESGSDNNDLTNATITGSVTNNGGAGNDW